MKSITALLIITSSVFSGAALAQTTDYECAQFLTDNSTMTLTSNGPSTRGRGDEFDYYSYRLDLPGLETRYGLNREEIISILHNHGLRLVDGSEFRNRSKDSIDVSFIGPLQAQRMCTK